jgi:hypothetical protein
VVLQLCLPGHILGLAFGLVSMLTAARCVYVCVCVCVSVCVCVFVLLWCFHDDFVLGCSLVYADQSTLREKESVHKSNTTVTQLSTTVTPLYLRHCDATVAPLLHHSSTPLCNLSPIRVTQMV